VARGLPPTRTVHKRYGSAFLVIALCSACAESVPSSSACRNLVYKDTGLSRAEYLPCAGEMIAALDDVASQSEKAFSGDRQARADGEAALGRLRALMNAAGGRNLLERWRDAALTDMNLDISNAVTHYEAFYMVRILEEPHQFAAKTRKAAEDELRQGARSYSEARSAYRRLR